MYASIFTSEAAGKNTLHKIACQFSPLIEEINDQTVVFDIEGTSMLIGTCRDVAKAIAATATEYDIVVNIAIARRPDTALLAAQFMSGITIILPGREAQHLSSLPIEALSSCLNSSHNKQKAFAEREAEQFADVIDTLLRWGIVTFKDFTRLSESSVSARLGPFGLKLHRYAKGIIDRPLNIKNKSAELDQSMDLDFPIDSLEPFSFVLHRLINQLCSEAKSSGLAVQELQLKLFLEDKTECERMLRLPFPTLDERSLLSHLMLVIKSDPPLSPIISLALSADPVKPRTAQPGLFEKGAPEPEKLQLTLSKIERLVGADNIGSPTILDTYRPDGIALKKFEVIRSTRSGSSSRGKLIAEKPKPSNPRIALRMFRPALPANVREISGCPTAVSAKTVEMQQGVRGSIVNFSGPWRTSGEWWGSTVWERDEWDIALGDGSLYKIYRDLRSNSWFIEGVYD